MQAASDSFLGWCRVTGIDGVRRDFYVRQLWDGKGSTEVEGMPPAGLEIYARLCAWTLARAHARSGDAIAIGAYLGSGERFDLAPGRVLPALRRPERKGLRGDERGDRLRPPPGRERLSGSLRIPEGRCRVREWRSGESSPCSARPSS